MEDRASGPAPEVARVGATEDTTKAHRIGRGVFTRAASGRWKSPRRSEGITKAIFEKADDRVIGASMVGLNAGDLIAAAARAVGTGADAAKPGRSIHPRSPPSKTANPAAGTSGGAAADLNLPKLRS